MIDYKLMDKLLKLEYENRGTSFSDNYLFQMLNSNRKDVLRAAYDIKDFIDKYKDKFLFCRIEVFTDETYRFLEFYERETEQLIEVGFEKMEKILKKTSQEKVPKKGFFERPLVKFILAIIGALIASYFANLLDIN